MQTLYAYNLKTHTLHIEGLCHHTFEGMHYGNEYKLFATEDEALAFEGRAVGMCKQCQQKRDAILRELKLKGELK